MTKEGWVWGGKRPEEMTREELIEKLYAQCYATARMLGVALGLEKQKGRAEEDTTKMQITVGVGETSILTLVGDVQKGHYKGYDFGSTIRYRCLYVALDGKTYALKVSDVVQAVVIAHTKAKL